MRFKVGYSCSITHCRSDNQICSWCGNKIGEGKYAYSLRKKCDFNSYNIWIHFNCLDNMYCGLKNCFEKSKDERLVELI